MRILIVEDEKPAAEKLRKGIQSYDPDIQIAGVLTGVKQTIQWLKNNPSPDLILLDIELSDGRSLEIFRKVHVSCPVIFTTAYDQFLLEAFDHNAIDYLLKPLKQDKLGKALDRYFKLKRHFVADYSGLLAESDRPRYKSRLIVRLGNEHRAVAVDDIAYFTVEHRSVFITTRDARKMLTDKTMANLEQELDPALFFRLNRQVVAALRGIRKFRAGDKGKIEIELDPPCKRSVIVSQERASAFKAWLDR